MFSVMIIYRYSFPIYVRACYRVCDYIIVMDAVAVNPREFYKKKLVETLKNKMDAPNQLEIFRVDI